MVKEMRKLTSELIVLDHFNFRRIKRIKKLWHLIRNMKKTLKLS